MDPRQQNEKSQKWCIKMETNVLKDKAWNLASLQPQQFDISLICNFPKALVEVFYFNLDAKMFFDGCAINNKIE